MVEIAIAKLKKYKSPGSDQILAQLIQAGGETLVSVVHKVINSIWNKEELPDQWKESIIVPIHKMGDETEISYIRQILEKKWEYNDTVHQLFIDCEKAYDSMRRELLYNILREFGITRAS
jgi:hypothetical protein